MNEFLKILEKYGLDPKIFDVTKAKEFTPPFPTDAWPVKVTPPSQEEGQPERNLDQQEIEEDEGL
jgi:hypothetical protein